MTRCPRLPAFAARRSRNWRIRAARRRQGSRRACRATPALHGAAPSLGKYLRTASARQSAPVCSPAGPRETPLFIAGNGLYSMSLAQPAGVGANAVAQRGIFPIYRRRSAERVSSPGPESTSLSARCYPSNLSHFSYAEYVPRRRPAETSSKRRRAWLTIKRSFGHRLCHRLPNQIEPALSCSTLGFVRAISSGRGRPEQSRRRSIRQISTTSRGSGISSIKSTWAASRP